MKIEVLGCDFGRADGIGNGWGMRSGLGPALEVFCLRGADKGCEFELLRLCPANPSATAFFRRIEG